MHQLSIYVLILISILLEKEQNNNDSKCLKFNEKIAAWRLSISLGLDPIQSSLIALSQPNTRAQLIFKRGIAKSSFVCEGAPKIAPSGRNEPKFCM